MIGQRKPKATNSNRSKKMRLKKRLSLPDAALQKLYINVTEITVANFKITVNVNVFKILFVVGATGRGCHRHRHYHYHYHTTRLTWSLFPHLVHVFFPHPWQTNAAVLATFTLKHILHVSEMAFLESPRDLWMIVSSICLISLSNLLFIKERMKTTYCTKLCKIKYKFSNLKDKFRFNELMYVIYLRFCVNLKFKSLNFRNFSN